MEILTKKTEPYVRPITKEENDRQNKRYIEIYPVTSRGEVEYQIRRDKKNSPFGVDKWRNTKEKINEIRKLNIMHKFGKYRDCITKGGWLKMVSAGWITNDLDQIIDLLNQRVQQHETHDRQLLFALDDKQAEIDFHRKEIEKQRADIELLMILVSDHDEFYHNQTPV